MRLSARGLRSAAMVKSRCAVHGDCSSTGQSTGLWLRGLRVQVPSVTLDGEGGGGRRKTGESRAR